MFEVDMDSLFLCVGCCVTVWNVVRKAFYFAFCTRTSSVMSEKPYKAIECC